MVTKRKILKERCLDELRNGTTIPQIRRKYGSGSALASAIQDFIEEKIPLVEEIQNLHQTKNNLNNEVKLRTEQKQDLERNIIKNKKTIEDHRRP